MKSEFTYEVAVTFLSEHKAVALRIKDGLADRLSTFVYDREQPTVVGTNTDGVEAFSNVFRHESRVCVVLHSDGWGKVGYTRSEEHTSELQSRLHLVCRLLLEKKKKKTQQRDARKTIR